MRRSLFAFAVAALLLALSAPAPAAPTGDEPIPYRQVEIVFALDTTGSMSSMISATKQKIWSIVRALSEAESTPAIQLGFVAYRDRNDAYVTQRIPLTQDIDAAYVRLMEFEAGGGGDTPESVNQALHEAVSLSKWSEGADTLRVVFLVGDAPPKMNYGDDVPYPHSCARAAQMGIRVHTIQCGGDTETRKIWREIATCARGNYFAVTQGELSRSIETPFDVQLALHARLLDGTILPYGNDEQQELQHQRLDAARTIDKKAPAEAKAERARVKARAAGLVTDGDLVSDVQSGAADLASMPEDRLPPQLRNLPPERRRQYLDDLFRQRRGLRSEIEWFSHERDQYIQEHYSQDDALDRRVIRALLGSAEPESD
jgi:hypothetical protein